MNKYFNSTVVFFHLNNEATYHDQCAAGTAVEFKGHHVGLLVHLTFASWVIEVQDTVVDAFLCQETVGQSKKGRPLLANCGLT